MYLIQLPCTVMLKLINYQIHLIQKTPFSTTQLKVDLTKSINLMLKTYFSIHVIVDLRHIFGMVHLALINA